MTLCACGCGLTAPIARDNCRTRGQVKGQPMKWRQGHAMRAIEAKSYRVVSAPTGGVVHVHRIRAEAALGRPLPPKAVVHHADGTKGTESTLVICQDQKYHMLLHARMRVRDAGGDPDMDKVCWRCGRVKVKGEFGVNRSQWDGRSGQCLECRRLEVA